MYVSYFIIYSLVKKRVKPAFMLFPSLKWVVLFWCWSSYLQDSGFSDRHSGSSGSILFFSFKFWLVPEINMQMRFAWSSWASCPGLLRNNDCVWIFFLELSTSCSALLNSWWALSIIIVVSYLPELSNDPPPIKMKTKEPSIWNF